MIPIYGQNVIVICQDLDGFTKFNIDLPTTALFWNVIQGNRSARFRRYELLVKVVERRGRVSSDMSTIEVEITERENAIPEERVRAVGMCFYGRGRDLTKDRTYKLGRNPNNPKDGMCIEIKEGLHIKATLNAKIARLLAPLVDNGTVWEKTW